MSKKYNKNNPRKSYKKYYNNNSLEEKKINPDEDFEEIDFISKETNPDEQVLFEEKYLYFAVVGYIGDETEIEDVHLLYRPNSESAYDISISRYIYTQDSRLVFFEKTLIPLLEVVYSKKNYHALSREDEDKRLQVCKEKYLKYLSKKGITNKSLGLTLK